MPEPDAALKEARISHPPVHEVQMTIRTTRGCRAGRCHRHGCVRATAAGSCGSRQTRHAGDYRKIEQLRRAVGQKWAYAVHFWCEEPRANRPDDPVIPTHQAVRQRLHHWQHRYDGLRGSNDRRPDHDRRSGGQPGRDAAPAGVQHARVGSRKREGDPRRSWPCGSLRRRDLFPGAIRLESLRVGDRLVTDGEPAATRAQAPLPRAPQPQPPQRFRNATGSSPRANPS